MASGARRPAARPSPCIRRSVARRSGRVARCGETGDGDRRCSAHAERSTTDAGRTSAPAGAQRSCSALPRPFSRPGTDWRCSGRWTWANRSSYSAGGGCAGRRALASPRVCRAIDKCYDEIAPTGRNALAMITRETDRRDQLPSCPGTTDDHGRVEAQAAGHQQLGGAKPEDDRNATVPSWPSQRIPACSAWCGALRLEAGGRTAPCIPGGCDRLHQLHTRASRRINSPLQPLEPQAGVQRAGWQSAVLVFDFHDLGVPPPPRFAGGLFFNQGENCNAPSRVLVHARVADGDSSPGFTAAGHRLPPVDPLLPGHGDGARWSTTPTAHGVGCQVAGDEAPLSPAAAADTGPTRAYLRSSHGVATMPQQMKIAREGSFGPVMTVHRASTTRPGPSPQPTTA